MYSINLCYHWPNNLFSMEYEVLYGADTIHRERKIVLRWEMMSGKASWKRGIPKVGFFYTGAKRQKVYVHDYSVLKAQRRRFSVEEIPFLKTHKLNAYWNFEVEYRVFPALMHFQTGSSILVPGTGDIKMSPPNTNGVVEEGSKSAVISACHQCREWETLKVEKLRFHLRVFGNVKKLWNLLPSCCCDDRMVNTWCFLQQEDGQMVPVVPLVRL